LAPILRALGERPRLAVLVLGLLSLVLVLVGATDAVRGKRAGSSSRDADGDAAPSGDTSAKPAQLVPSGRPAPARSGRPNIVMLLTDDMRADDLRWMPNVQHLVADEGLTFHNSFSTYPLCAPARASLLTGQYAHDNGVYSHVAPYGFSAFDDRRTIGTSLNAAGYNTLFLGKYLNGYGSDNSKVTGGSSFRYVPPGWTDWFGSVDRPAGSGYDSGGTYQYNDLLINHNGTIDHSHKGQYQTRVQGRIARGLVKRYHRSPKPFFLYWAPIAPHFGLPRESDDPVDVTWPGTARRERIKTPARPPGVRGRFDRQILRASGMPADGGPAEGSVADKPRPMRSLPELSRQERFAVRNLTRQRAEALFVLDQQVKRLVTTLRRAGELAHTVFIFTSDNGYFLGEHRVRQGKIKDHEPSLRVPFVVSGPGIPTGQRYDPITTEDITATILDLAHARPPHPADGRSVVSSFAGDRGWRVPLLTEGLETSSVFRDAARSPVAGFDDPRTYIGLRTPRWKYTLYDDGDGELYDLDTDPNELHNRFDDPAYADVQAELHRLWEQRKDCSGSACSAPMPASLQRDPSTDRTSTLHQLRLVDRRYGHAW
jgi:N-acetylglucosamine-6-sulfatase